MDILENRVGERRLLRFSDGKMNWPVNRGIENQFLRARVRVYMTSLMPIPDRIKRVEIICKPYLDRIFSISGEPYFDELISELKMVYS